MHSIVQELSYRLDDPSDGTINVSLVINLVDPTFCLPVRLYIIRVVRLAVEEPIATLGDPVGTKSLVEGSKNCALCDCCRATYIMVSMLRHRIQCDGGR
jgi:hypothetical protein